MIMSYSKPLRRKFGILMLVMAIGTCVFWPFDPNNPNGVADALGLFLVMLSVLFSMAIATRHVDGESADTGNRPSVITFCPYDGSSAC